MRAPGKSKGDRRFDAARGAPWREGYEGYNTTPMHGTATRWTKLSCAQDSHLGHWLSQWLFAPGVPRARHIQGPGIVHAHEFDQAVAAVHGREVYTASWRMPNCSLDANAGQNALAQVRAFDEAVGLVSS